MIWVGIDLGGTNLAVGLVREDGRIISQASVPTGAPDTGLIIGKMAEMINGLADEAHISMDEIGAIGIGVPGNADQETGRVEYANNLGMESVPILELTRPYFPDTPMTFDNDANAAAWAEYMFGAGKGSNSMIMITLGTGIGAGIILDGKMFEGINYAAGELGHMTIRFDGLPCNCGRRGCLERYASASALAEQAREAMRGAPGSLMWEVCGGDISRMNGKLFFEAARQKDAAALRVLDRFTRYLSAGIIDVVNLFQPELICIGGGISKAGELLLAPVRKQLEKENYARSSRKQTLLRTASLGNDAGIIGAAHLAKWRLGGCK